MFFLSEKPEFVDEVYKEAPSIGTPFVVNDKEKTIAFYKNDSMMNQIVEGYNKGPENSYAKELTKKYPLCNE